MKDILCFDTDQSVAPVTAQLIAQFGADPPRIVAIRYFSRGSQGKCLSNAECRAIEAADARCRARGGYFLVGIVYEMGPSPRGSVLGRADGAYTRLRLAQIGAPQGAWVAYASDEDAPGSSDAMNALVDAFRAFFDQLKDASGNFTVNRAAYAAGATYDLLDDVGVISFRWVTQSMGFSHSKKDVEDGDYDLRQGLPKRIAGLDADPNFFRPGLIPDGSTPEVLGFFVPKLPEPSLPDSVLPGSDYDDVAALQIALNKQGAQLDVDGVYGPGTTGAVRAFQQAQAGLDVDGLAGPKTISDLKGLA